MFHPDFTVGDAEIVSNDGVRFRVDRTRLSAASPALRDLAARAPAAPISPFAPPTTAPALPNPAATLAPFLAAALGDDPLEGTSAHDVLRARDTLILLQAYGCTAAVRAAVTELKVRLMDGAACPVQVFVLAAHLRDIDLCRTAIVYGDVPAQAPKNRPSQNKPSYDDVFYDSDDETDSYGSGAGSSPLASASPSFAQADADADALEPAAVLAHLETIPQEYRAAMAAAWNSSSDPRDRGNSFVRHMSLAAH